MRPVVYILSLIVIAIASLQLAHASIPANEEIPALAEDGYFEAGDYAGLVSEVEEFIATEAAPIALDDAEVDAAEEEIAWGYSNICRNGAIWCALPVSLPIGSRCFVNGYCGGVYLNYRGVISAY